MFLLTSVQWWERNVVCLSQQDVILKPVVTHCFEQPKPLLLMSCSLLIMFLPFRIGYCYFLHLHFINFCFCFDNRNTLCHWDFSIALGPFSVSYSGSGGAFVCQNKRGGHCDNVWTLNGWLGVSHHFQGFGLKVFTPWPLLLIVSIWPLLDIVCIIKRGNERGPSACSITGRFISQILWHLGIMQRAQKFSACSITKGEEVEEPIW